MTKARTHTKKNTPPRTKTRIVQIIQMMILTTLFTILPQQNSYSFRAETEVFTPQPILFPPPVSAYPVNTFGILPPELTAQGIIVVDIPSGVTLFEKNADTTFLPASTTKIMTALISLTKYKLDEVITVNTVITEGQGMGLVSGETITVENLLYGILVNSANDAAFTLAQHHPQGVTGFVADMNQFARLLHLTNTHYTNAIGFDDSNQYTTARDLARLSIYALKQKVFAKIVGVPQITVSDTSFRHFHALKNINELLGKVPGVSGLKTGWTEAAGQTLVTTVERNEHKVLIVVLKSEDRFAETETLLNWVFTTFSWQDIKPPTS